MAPVGRKRDQIDLQDNVARRVRNLETGVHPLRSDLRYYDSYDPTPIVWTSSILQENPAGSTDTSPFWLRRIGIVQLGGNFRLTGGATPAGALPAEEYVATLPEPARPLVDLVFGGTMSRAPFFFRYRIETNGDMFIINPGGSSVDPSFSLSGSSYTAN